MPRKRYGLEVVPVRGGFEVHRHGRRFWARTYRTERTAKKWLLRAVKECAQEPLAGLHFAPAHIRRFAITNTKGA